MIKQRPSENSTNYVVGLTYIGRENSVFGRVTLGHGVHIFEIRQTTKKRKRVEKQRRKRYNRTQEEAREIALSASQRGQSESTHARSKSAYEGISTATGAAEITSSQSNTGRY